jgi:hypothetical protein
MRTCISRSLSVTWAPDARSSRVAPLDRTSGRRHAGAGARLFSPAHPRPLRAPWRHQFLAGRDPRPGEGQYEPPRGAVRAHGAIFVGILYGDHEGGQRTITRFFITPRTRSDDEEPWLRSCTTVRHWNLDRADPR